MAVLRGGGVCGDILDLFGDPAAVVAASLSIEGIGDPLLPLPLPVCMFSTRRDGLILQVTPIWGRGLEKGEGV